MSQSNYSRFKNDEYLYPEPVSWSQIFDDLKENDVRPMQISELIGVAYTTIVSLQNRNSEPRHSIGVSILQLHTRYCST